MRILVAAPIAYGSAGGVERYSTEVATRLAADHGHAVGFLSVGSVAPTDGPLEHFVLPPRFHVASTPVGAWSDGMGRVLEQFRPDVVIGHMPVPYLADVAARASARRRIPFALTYHNDITTGGVFALARELYYGAVFPKTLRASDRIIVTNEAYAATSKRLAAARDRVRIAPCGIAHPQTSGTNAGEREPIVLFVGRLHPMARHKGLDVLLHAMREVHEQVPGARLRVIGDGPDRLRYVELADRFGLCEQTEFVGAATAAQLADAYRSSRVCVLPSTSRAEGFGIVLIEAQSFGTPVVGTTVGGIPSALRDGESGLLVPPGDAHALSRAVVDLLRDPGKATKCGAAGRDFTRGFTWAESARSTHAIVQEIVQ